MESVIENEAILPQKVDGQSLHTIFSTYRWATAAEIGSFYPGYTRWLSCAISMAWVGHERNRQHRQRQNSWWPWWNDQKWECPKNFEFWTGTGHYKKFLLGLHVSTVGIRLRLTACIFLDAKRTWREKKPNLNQHRPFIDTLSIIHP